MSTIKKSKSNKFAQCAKLRREGLPFGRKWHGFEFLPETKKINLIKLPLLILLNCALAFIKIFSDLMQESKHGLLC